MLRRTLFKLALIPWLNIPDAAADGGDIFDPDQGDRIFNVTLSPGAHICGIRADTPEQAEQRARDAFAAMIKDGTLEIETVEYVCDCPRCLRYRDDPIVAQVANAFNLSFHTAAEHISYFD